MFFPLADALKAPEGMVLSPPATWGDYIGFIGWVGPYKMPAYYADRYEVTNREYQKFVDSGGYENRKYWPATFSNNGHDLSSTEAMAQFRDTTGRPGPSNWVGGHYPEGKAEYPVSGVSWFEASAYAAFTGKSLPVLAQWFQLANPEVAGNAIPLSNISTQALAPVGTYQGLGAAGTYDMAGNVREWVMNSVDQDLRFILGGSWRSPTYLYYCPEALSPFDRSDTNGFRTVRNLEPLPEMTAQPIRRSAPDFAKLKPISDDVFRAYEALYSYPRSPLNAKSEGIVKETADWREEKITFDTAYGERMSAYLYLPKNVKPPYQTVLFFPSARVQFLPAGVTNGELGDTKFFDYVVQSGRAVMYPIYQQTYDRRVKFYLPTAEQDIDLTTEWYKDAARSLDYLATRSDIDSSRLGYLGVSMGAADGVIISTLLQDRLKTAIFLDGGYFLETPPAGGSQADFAPRLKKPVLMVNGQHDFTFSVEKSQNPLFAMLGSPPEDKQHIILDTPHDVTEQRPQLVKAVLDWLDKYLGRVGP
jgi:dienelactone hydrolase